MTINRKRDWTRRNDKAVWTRGRERADPSSSVTLKIGVKGLYVQGDKIDGPDVKYATKLTNREKKKLKKKDYDATLHTIPYPRTRAHTRALAHGKGEGEYQSLWKTRSVVKAAVGAPG